MPFILWLGKLLAKVGLAPIGLISNLFSFTMGIVMSDLVSPAMRFMKHRNESIHKSQILSPAETISLFFKGSITKNKLYENLSYHGYSSEKVNQLLTVNEILLNVNDISSLLHRKEISEQEAIARIKRLGYDDKEVKELLKLSLYIPTPPDMIRFAVRDVLSPDVVSKYGLLQDYPAELNGLLTLAGMDTKYGKYYWGAHWELPSLTQAFDMYHRGIITSEDIDLLLKTADVLPYWRPKMKQLSETPFTRVDLGRMFQLGVLTFPELVRGYQDLGYSKEKATKMAEFISKKEVNESRELTKSELVRSYDSGIITEGQLNEFLVGLGYDKENVNLIVTLANTKKATRFTNTYITALKKQFLKGMIDRQEGLIRLNKLNLHSQAVEQLLDAWELEVEAKTGKK